MKNKLETLMLLTATLLNQFSFAQNLVPNWSFEDTVNCPVGGSEIYNAVGWNSYSHTPDYFNSCSNGIVSIPSNFAGFQNPKSGNAFAGIISYYSIIPNLREFIGTQLTQPLIIGEKYYLSFFVNMAFSNSSAFRIAINNIGVRLSTVAYSSITPVPIDNYSQIYSVSIIADSLNWVNIAGSLVADSMYDFISIGNFFNDSVTSVVSLDSNALYAYYYIDDIRFSTDSNFVNRIPVLDFNNQLNITINTLDQFIEVNAKEIQSIILYDILGRSRYDWGKGITSKVRVDTIKLEHGIYLLYVNIKGQSFVRKVLIQ